MHISRNILRTVFVLLLVSCSKVQRMGMDSVALPLQDTALLSDQSNPSAFKTSNSFIVTTRKGDIISFEQSDGTWVATVNENLPVGFSNKLTLPVYFNTGFTVESLAGYNLEKQQKSVLLEKASDGRQCVYVGERGLLGGGRWNYTRCSTSGCDNNWLKCGRCGWQCNEGSDFGTHGLHFIPVVGSLIIWGRHMSNSGNPGGGCDIQYCADHCTCVCRKHVVYCPKCDACPTCKAGCKQCCAEGTSLTHATKELEIRCKKDVEVAIKARKKKEEQEKAEKAKKEASKAESRRWKAAEYQQAQQGAYERQQQADRERRQREEEAFNNAFNAGMGFGSFGGNAGASDKSNSSNKNNTNQGW